MHDNDKFIQAIKRSWLSFGKKVHSLTTWISILFLFVVIVVVLFVVSGYFLPEESVVKISVPCSVPLQQVKENLWDVKSYSKWKRGLRSVDIVKEKRSSITWREHYANNSLDYNMQRSKNTYEVKVRSYQMAKETKQSDSTSKKEASFQATVIYKLALGETGTTISIEERSFYKNLFFRTISFLFKGKRLKNQMKAFRNLHCQ